MRSGLESNADAVNTYFVYTSRPHAADSAFGGIRFLAALHITAQLTEILQPALRSAPDSLLERLSNFR